MTPHAIVVLPKTDGMEMLLCYEDEGVYVNTYGRITKDVVLQWGEMPTSVGASHPYICIRVRSVCFKWIFFINTGVIKTSQRNINESPKLKLRGF